MSSTARLILCPQCHHSFPTPVGTVTACPRCGKVVLIPQVETPPSAPAIPPEHMATLPVVCRLCGSRYYAKPKEMGHNLKCPDCHTENLVVPLAPAPSLTHSAAPLPEEDDGFNLSAPVDLPKNRALTTEGAQWEAMLQQSPTPPAPTVPPRSPATPPPQTFPPNYPHARPGPPPPATSTLPVTGAHAAATQAAQTAAMSSSQTTAQPSASPPVTSHRRPWTDVMKDSTSAPRPQRTSPERPRQNEEHEPRHKPRDMMGRLAWLEQHPYTLGVIPLFRQTQVFARWISVSILAAGQLSMLWLAWEYRRGDDTAQVLGTLMIVALMFSVIPTIIALTSLALTIFEDTANGNDQIASWPEFNLLEWALESVYFLGAFFVSGLPGGVVGLYLYGYSSTSLGDSLLIGLPLLALSWYCFFPLIFISMQETGTVMEPFSTAILKSLFPLKFRWLAFYLTSFFWILFVLSLVIPLFYFGFGSKNATTACMLLIPSGLLLTAFPVVYFRLLGKIAMLTRDYLAALEEGTEAPEEEQLDIQALAIRNQELKVAAMSGKAVPKAGK